MPTTEKLIEYDAREMWLDYGLTWPAERKRQYLLREDIIKPLSTDGMVWPSARDEQAATERDRLAALAALPYRDPAEELPHWDWHVTQDLWVLYLYMQQQPVAKPYWLVAISVLTSNPLTGEPARFTDMMRYLEAASPQPPERDPAYLPLGFDVSDGSLLSGLSNCGYTDDEVQGARDRWAKCLNQYHLFDDPTIAWQFKEFSDRRVPEHQPFYVFGLWLVEQVTEGTSQTPDR